MIKRWAIASCVFLLALPGVASAEVLPLPHHSAPHVHHHR